MNLISKYNQLLQDAFGTEAVISNDNCLISRGDSLLDDVGDKHIKSELPGVSDECWKKFVAGMIAAPLSAVSASNELGMFKIKPRRLSDLGLVNNLSRIKAPSGRTVWVADFKSPMTSSKFLRSPQAQYHVFSASMRDYAKKLNNGEIKKIANMSTSGALAILHKAGPNGLNTWEKSKKFPETQALHDKINGIF